MYYILVSSPFRSPIPSIAEAGHPTLTAASFGRKYSQSALYPAGFTVFRPARRDMSPHWTLLPNTTLLSRPPAFHPQRTTLLHHHDTLHSSRLFFFGIYSVASSFTLNPDNGNTVVPLSHWRFTPPTTHAFQAASLGALPSTDERHFRCYDFIIQHCDVCGQVCDVDNSLPNVFHVECSLGNHPSARL